MLGISVVIPAYNEENYLPATLEALNIARAKLSCPSEMIVVDNASSDRTAEVARSMGAVVVPHSVRNISSVRNAGLAVARYSMIVALDADCGCPPEGLVKIFDLLQKGAHVGGALGLRVLSPKLVTRVLARIIQAGVAQISGIHGAVFFFWRDDALAIGGFDETRLVAEDSAFAIALRKHGRLTNRKFTLFREVMITTVDRKETTLATVVPLAMKLLRVFMGARLTQKDLGYWYDPKR